ncbi:hypothetical protein [Streptomyces ipomoeae]|uniref:hypothetical protein n=1 Tax=Streptomyces ipomoeae TaxID=103232 RepID=UPI0011472DBF|nr:hypothetical protein [Streptomyces ipomoeae]TQE33150.1 hypothetical protein Sipo7851_21905 [Streptomyces ipomoeae]
MTLAALRTKAAYRIARLQETFLALLFATAGLIVARTVAGIAADSGMDLRWQIGLGAAGYALAITFLARLADIDPLETLIGATRSLANVASGLIHVAAAAVLLLGALAVALFGGAMSAPVTT